MRYSVRDMETLPQPHADGNRIAANGGRATAARTTAVGVLDRSVALLDLLGHRPRALRYLARARGLPRPTAHRLLVALDSHGLVARDAGGTFRLGPRLTELAARAGRGLELGTLAGPVRGRLHEQAGESVQLYVRSGDRRLCVAARDAGTGLRDSVPVGALLPLDAGSGGQVLLARAPTPPPPRAPAPGGRAPPPWPPPPASSSPVEPSRRADPASRADPSRPSS